MIVTSETYDRAASGMREGTVPALAWELHLHEPVVPVMIVPAQAAWLTRLSDDALGELSLDWRLLTARVITPERPALVRLDLAFADQQRLAVLWAVLGQADLMALLSAAHLGRIALRDTTTPKNPARAGVLLQDIGLRDLDGFAELTRIVRGPMRLHAARQAAGADRQPAS